MDRYRKDIDRIDREIADLLSKRLDVAGRIGAYKQIRDIPVLDEERERAKLEKFSGHFDQSKREYVTGVMEAVMEGSRRFQEDRKFKYALLGKRLGHSLSPQVHKALGGYEYGLVELEEYELDEFFDRFPLDGINVTIPYKKTVMKYCDTVSETAKASGSVNTIVKNEDGTLSGYNTDYDGFRYTIERSGVEVVGSKCLIFGSGGVSGTVKKVLEDCGAEEIVLISRKGEDNYENLNKHEDADILVNATPLGMYPEIGESPVDIERFSGCRAVFDLIYNPLRTRFMLQAMDEGIPAVGGLDMLVAQAAHAGRLFTGEDHRDKIERVCSELSKDRENIILIGMPGSGKTVIGKRLAELTGKHFTDSDEMIEKTCSMSPEEIIDSLGEEEFRNRESRVIEVLASEGGRIIATGGGVVEREENRDLLRANGRIVYIRRALEELAKDGRPLSTRHGVEDIYARRKDRYESWQDITVENIDVEEAANRVREKTGY